jgi:hypothetical protein
MSNKQYPKSLSEKSLQKKYVELNLADEKIYFLKQFILACTNLYGCISIRDIWEVYKKLAGITSVPKIKRTDIIRISEILRREELPYFVYEVDELYFEESRESLDREFVSRYLIGRGQGKFRWYYYVAEAQSCHDYYVPDNLLSFAQMPITEQEQRLLEFIGKLKVTAGEFKSRYGRILKCPDRMGETLDAFSFMNDMEKFEYQYAKGEIQGTKGNPKEAQHLLDENNSRTEAEKIVDQIKWYGNIGHVSPIDIIQYTLEELGEVGVELTEQQLKKLTQEIMNLHNYSHLMCIGGWRPADLAKQTGMPNAVSFGPGIRKAIAEGALNKEELVKAIKDMGLEYLEY